MSVTSSAGLDAPSSAVRYFEAGVGDRDDGKDDRVDRVDDMTLISDDCHDLGFGVMSFFFLDTSGEWKRTRSRCAREAGHI